MDEYTYTSTTTDSNGNVVSETKKSSTKTGGTEKKRDIELFPTLTYDDENYIFKQSVVQPGRNQYDKRPAFGIDNASNDERRKGTAVLREGHDMGEGRDFDALSLIYNGGKGLPSTREATRKLLLSKANKEHLDKEGWKMVTDTINAKPTEKEMNRFYKAAKKDREERSIGKKIGDTISGDASCGDMSAPPVGFLEVSDHPEYKVPIFAEKGFGKIKGRINLMNPAIDVTPIDRWTYNGGDPEEAYKEYLSKVQNLRELRSKFSNSGVSENDMMRAYAIIKQRYPNKSKFKVSVAYKDKHNWEEGANNNRWVRSLPNNIVNKK